MKTEKDGNSLSQEHNEEIQVIFHKSMDLLTKNIVNTNNNNNNNNNNNINNKLKLLLL